MSTANTASLWKTITCWIDAYADPGAEQVAGDKQIDWLRTLPFIALHAAVLLVFVLGWSPVAITVALFLYAIRMFAITGFYHRYFSHKAFKTSRLVQFIFAAIGASAIQRGPLWWASHHRLHHVHSDREQDTHSPTQHGFIWSHMGWFLSKQNFATRHNRIKDFARYPELRFLDRFDILMPLLLAISLYGLGEGLNAYWPELGTNGLQMLLWGFVISTVVLYHVTFTINSLAHRFGHRRFETRDDSRNNFVLALLTFGEGWHNNHHYYAGSARQGFAWWEVDITYYVLRMMQALGLIHGLRPVPAHVFQQRRSNPVRTSMRHVS